jgi:hypothetical protein
VLLSYHLVDDPDAIDLDTVQSVLTFRGLVDCAMVDNCGDKFPQLIVATVKRPVLAQARLEKTPSTGFEGLGAHAKAREEEELAKRADEAQHGAERKKGNEGGVGGNKFSGKASNTKDKGKKVKNAQQKKVYHTGKARAERLMLEIQRRLAPDAEVTPVKKSEVEEGVEVDHMELDDDINFGAQHFDGEFGFSEEGFDGKRDVSDDDPFGRPGAPADDVFEKHAAPVNGDELAAPAGVEGKAPCEEQEKKFDDLFSWRVRLGYAKTLEDFGWVMCTKAKLGINPYMVVCPLCPPGEQGEGPTPLVSVRWITPFSLF